MRSLRSYMASPYRHNLRINTICPITLSNTTHDVALVSAGVLTDPSLHGKALFVEGGRAGELEAKSEKPAEKQTEIQVLASASPDQPAQVLGGVPKIAAQAGLPY